MGRRLMRLGVAVFAATIVGAFAFAAPGNASATTIGPCDLPTEKVTSVQAQDTVKQINPRACLDITFTDKCDGTTVVKMSNGAFNDNKFTVLTVKLDGKEYTLKGGSDPNIVEVTLGPKVADLQAILVFRFTTDDGTVTYEKNFGDPWTWELPEACPTASPSPSVTASPSPSVTSTSPLYANCAAVEAAGKAPLNRGEPGYRSDLDSDDDGVACETGEGAAPLPVTGASLTAPLVTGVAATLLGVVGYVWLLIRRRKATIQ